MKQIFFIILFFLVYGLSADSSDEIHRAVSLLENSFFSQGIDKLQSVLSDEATDDNSKARALYELGRFYEDQAGDFDSACNFYRRASLMENLPKEQPINEKAVWALKKIEAWENQFTSQIRSLDKARADSSSELNRELYNQNISKLKKIIIASPDFHRTAEVYYYIGIFQSRLESYGEAIKSFSKALSIRPGVNLFLDVDWQIQTAETNRTRFVIRWVSWGMALVLSFLGIFLFFIARPWVWWKPVEMIKPLAAILVWSVFFYGTAFMLSQWVPDRPSEDLVMKLAPTFIFSNPGSPGSEIYHIYYFYGIIGIVLLYLFSLFLGQLKFPLLRSLSLVFSGVLIFASLSGLFYIKYCDKKSSLYPQTNALTGYFTGYMRFYQQDPEPLILTRPREYTNLSVIYVDDSVFAQWIVEHCPYDQPGDEVNIENGPFQE
ncbi:MAG: tetratricopeptide repeat protein [Spirochaetales bacterium]|nr:tetratricopeptide repeat protein [Spirochaetales bacterium]